MMTRSAFVARLSALEAALSPQTVAQVPDAV
jgi:hypothetical protein